MARRGKRCSGWRSVDYKPHHGQGHVPLGTEGGHACRKCWVPCKNRTDSGSYCSECLSRLSTDPRTIVRRSLAVDPETPDDMILFLTSDGDETVALVAREERDRRGINEEAAPVTASVTVIDDPWN